jgi:hypothetical protein
VLSVSSRTEHPLVAVKICYACSIAAHRVCDCVCQLLHVDRSRIAWQFVSENFAGLEGTSRLK